MRGMPVESFGPEFQTRRNACKFLRKVENPRFKEWYFTPFFAQVLFLRTNYQLAKQARLMTNYTMTLDPIVDPIHLYFHSWRSALSIPAASAVTAFQSELDYMQKPNTEQMQISWTNTTETLIIEICFWKTIGLLRHLSAFVGHPTSRCPFYFVVAKSLPQPKNHRAQSHFDYGSPQPCKSPKPCQNSKIPQCNTVQMQGVAVHLWPIPVFSALLGGQKFSTITIYIPPQSSKEAPEKGFSRHLEAKQRPDPRIFEARAPQHSPKLQKPVVLDIDNLQCTMNTKLLDIDNLPCTITFAMHN